MPGGVAYPARAMGRFRIRTGGRLGLRDALLALALFAAVVRALVPQGFMLAEHKGSVAVVICTADGSKTLAGVPRSGDQRGDGLASMNAPCAFAGLAMAAPPPAAPIVSLAQAIELRVAAVDAEPPAAVTAVHRPQSPRAPPRLHA